MCVMKVLHTGGPLPTGVMNNIWGRGDDDKKTESLIKKRPVGWSLEGRTGIQFRQVLDPPHPYQLPHNPLQPLQHRQRVERISV